MGTKVLEVSRELGRVGMRAFGVNRVLERAMAVLKVLEVSYVL